MSEITSKIIEQMIYVVRGQNVMLDSDLADLYEVETRYLNKAVKRNIKRFPVDFMFQLTNEEFKDLMFQIGTSKEGRGGRRKVPSVFTENGIAMLSGVLNSERAITVNISIMRIFTKLRTILMSGETLSNKVEKLEHDSKEMKKIFRIVFDKLNKLEGKTPILPRKRNKIGLK
tara:strand:+ start:111 stop:629 length:519 start_codon:yes stop_codon:yes gene_type:complete